MEEIIELLGKDKLLRVAILRSEVPGEIILWRIPLSYIIKHTVIFLSCCRWLDNFIKVVLCSEF